MPDYFDFTELAFGQMTTHVDSAIDIGSIGLTPGYKVSALQPANLRVLTANVSMLPGANSRVFQFFRGGFVFDQDANGLTDKRLGHSNCHVMLCGHRSVSSFLFDLG